MADVPSRGSAPLPNLTSMPESQDQAFDFIGWIGRQKQRRGVDATQEHLGLAQMAYFNGNPIGLRDTVALCGSERPLPKWASVVLLRLVDALIKEVSVGRGHGKIKNRLDELQKQFACWEALRSARRSGRKGEKAVTAAATTLEARGLHVAPDTIKKYHQAVARQRRRLPGLYYHPRT
jgi:hypothetical protein